MASRAGFAASYLFAVIVSAVAGPILVSCGAGMIGLYPSECKDLRWVSLGVSAFVAAVLLPLVARDREG